VKRKPSPRYSDAKRIIDQTFKRRTIGDTVNIPPPPRIILRPDPIVSDALKRGPIRIDIGSGAHPQQGFIGIDLQPFPGVVRQDLEVQPWPFPDGCAELAIASHVVEHINPAKFGFINFMNEVWRILKPDAKFLMALPYAGSYGYYQDPTHVNPCNEATWAYFDPLHDSGLYRFYRPKPWRIETCQFEITGNMEVSLVKRREDPSYAR